MQLDFLARYPDKDRLEIYGSPNSFNDLNYYRDNPNWEPTEYENVFKKYEIR